MITGFHTILYSSDAAATRAFFRDVLGFHAVDAGQGWLILALPPGELAAHPNEDNSKLPRHEFYLMCDDIAATIADLKGKGAQFSTVPNDHGWGIMAMMKVPGAGDLGLYQPLHPTAIKQAK